MCDMKQLIKERGLIKAKLTRFRTYFSSVSSSTEITQLKLRLSKLEECWSEFDRIQLQIELSDEAESEQLEERDNFESEYFTLTSAAQRFISNHENKPQISQPVSVKLPDIQLPVFSGRYDEWVSFHDTFVSLIHSRDMSEIHKFHYLKCSLKGEASDILSSLESSVENYHIAWKLLNDRYGNKRYLINKHVSALFNLPKIDKGTSVSHRKLLDNALKHIRALTGLGQPTQHWDTLIIHIITTKLDSLTLHEWENTLETNKLPTMAELESFLQHKCQVMESVESNISHKPLLVNSQIKVQPPRVKPVGKNNSFSTNCHISTKRCSLCNEPQHPIYLCTKFKSLPIPEREKEVKRQGLCFNCLNGHHKIADCKSGSCKNCGKKHNTLLHYAKSEASGSDVQISVSNGTSPNKIIQKTVASTSNVSGVQLTPIVMLSTAVVSVLDFRGASHLCRALLDNGSQSNFMTERAARLLKLPPKKNVLEVCGVGQTSTTTTHSVECVLKSRVNSFSTCIECVVLPSITQKLPTVPINLSKLDLPQNLQLADPDFHKPSDIDILIGAELFYDIICEGKIKCSDLAPTLQNSVFGWIISGKIQIDKPVVNLSTMCNLSTLDDINKNIQKFWTLEECAGEKQFTGDDRFCEELYNSTTIRYPDGRYCVQIPLKGDLSELGESKRTAVQRLLSLERRLSTNAELKSHYANFIREYECLGHMKEISCEEAEATKSYYIPHHPVLKEDSTTTRLRVVFDASCKTSSGVSLNDLSLVGPTVQSELINIVIRFRIHAFVMTADIEKMYRQVRIYPSQTNLQLILWREDANQPIKTYKLLTVTYGTASAPYLATRTLKQLATDEKQTFPAASKVMTEDFYVDDVMTGANTLQEAKQLQEDLISLCSRGGFHLRKWCANDPNLLSNISSEDVHQTNCAVDQDARIKTLGLIWNPKKDVFQFSFNKLSQNKQMTKRTILAAIGRIFDPLGLIGPVILTAKLIMQTLWSCKIGWDEDIPTEIRNKWISYQESIHLVASLEIPRCLINKPVSTCRVEIHGFSDASESAYGACVYLKSIDASNNVTVNLIMSKSRVAPLKTVSLPRLELCGALLLSKLTKLVINSLQIEINSVYHYTDSTIVLAWINSSSSHWTTFVANRVAKIQNNSDVESWKYVRGEENPADFLSRGLLPHQIIDNNLYWIGPSFLHTVNTEWHLPDELKCEEIPEHHAQIIAHATVTQVINYDNFSTFTKAVHVLAYCLRFIFNCRFPKRKFCGPLSVQEIERAEIQILKLIQRESFSKEICDLTAGKAIHKNSHLVSLNPYLDNDNLIRVGGRLQASDIHLDQKNPIVLPKNHRLTDLIARHVHVKNLHIGPQSLLNSMRQKYWPIGGRNLVRKIFHQCVRCFRTRPKSQAQLMGNLPEARVKQPRRAFINTGIDYCGPFFVKTTRKRGVRPHKCYVSLFICFNIKAVHLELAEDMTSGSFISALRRFMARRGKPTNIYSDNGTNFVGACKELKELRELFISEQFQSVVIDTLINDGIQWHFQPPSAPHFGGLWESSVKLVKNHMKRVIGCTCLTLIEFSTLLTQIEACVNSRPLTPMSEEPTDLLPLTPSHFLIGDVLTSVPEPTLISLPMNRLNHWQQIQQMMQHFWSRWSKEYLNNLQQRSKWVKPTPNIEVNDLVVLKEDNLPPLHWKLARVVEVHPGSDNHVRVVTIRTSSGVMKRPVTKLCPLPKN